MAGSLGELAAALRKAGEQLELNAARECAADAGQAYLQVLRGTTPVLTGHLRASERVDSVRGGGTFAVATIGAHTVYASFRETGGTIHVKGARVLSNGSAFFGKSVTQAGSHYFERADAASGGPIDEACENAIAQILSDAGL
jgi:hypothetical protein